jgi:hypothetical protein
MCPVCPDVPALVREAFTIGSPPVLTLWKPQRLDLALEHSNLVAQDEELGVLDAVRPG